MDAGPLVAVLHEADRNHDRCVAILRSIREPIGSVWPVITEAMCLLRFSWESQDALWNLIATEAILLMALRQVDAPRMWELMQKYRDLPMDLADAALVRVAEREGIRRVFTIDRRGFSLYRPRGIGRFQIIP